MSLEQNPEVIVDDILLVNHYVNEGDRIMVVADEGLFLGRFAGHQREKFDLDVKSLKLTETFHTSQFDYSRGMEVDRADLAVRAESLAFLQEERNLIEPEREVDIVEGFVVFRFIEE